MSALTTHLHAAVGGAVQAGFFDWTENKATAATGAISAVAGVVLLIVGIVIVVANRHSIGKLLGGVVVLVIATALVSGGVVASLAKQVDDEVKTGAPASHSSTLL